MTTQKYTIIGMTCSACSSHIERAIGSLGGVKTVGVNLLSNSMTVTFDEKTLTSQTIINTVKSAGYQAALPNAKAEPTTMTDEISSMKIRLIISIIFMLPLFYISMGHMIGLPLPAFLTGHNNSVSFAFTQFLLTLPIIYVNFKYFTSGLKALIKRSPNMNSLIAIGCTAAVVYGIYAIYKIGYGMGNNQMDLVHRYSMDLYFESAAMILTLITLGKFFEARAKGKTSEAITKLVNLAPKTAILLRNGVETEIPTEEIAANDIVIIKAGNTMPVDGIVTSGNGVVDESAITGESIPVQKQEDDKTTGGTILKSGYLQVKATKVGADSTLSQIIKLVEEASSSKADISKLADRVSRVFVPIVILIAVVSFVVWMLLGQSFEFAISIAISVLVISCPCALGLATPTAIMVGTGKGAQNGILIKSAQSLEILHEVKTVVLDKTGTITMGKPEVTDIIPFNGFSADELLSIAYTLEMHSEHPLGEAIISYSNQTGKTSSHKLDQYETLSGMGISGVIDGERYYAGSLKLLAEKGVSFDAKDDNLSEQGKTPLYFSDEKNIIGIIAVMDTIKPTSKEAISLFKAMGIKTLMLTGDNVKTANAIKNAVGVDEVIASVMPQQKEECVRKLMQSGERVAMIGDGINDSPALASADVGIAIGAGTDIAIESADIVLMRSDLLDAVTAISLSKATIRNIKQNLFWALFYNTLGIPLAAGVFYFAGIMLNPMFAAAAMSLSSLFVVGNALRLKLFKANSSHISHAENNNSAKNLKEIEENKAMTNLTKIITIDKMMCDHCKGRVTEVLSGIDGVSNVVVDLASKTATVVLDSKVTDEMLKNAISGAGYEVISIGEKL